MVLWAIEIAAKSYGIQFGREVVNGVVEIVAKFHKGKRGREGINANVEAMPCYSLG